MHSRQHPGVLEKGRASGCAGDKHVQSAGCRAAEHLRRWGVSTQSVGFEVLVPRRKLPAGLLRTEKRQ